MDKFVIEGRYTLSGEVRISGAKNAALPIMAATLLWPGHYLLHGVPDLRDTRTFIRLLEIIGAKTTFRDNRLEVDTTSCDNPEAPYELVKTMRASFYVLGPLLARFGQCKVSLPGGCNWGPRPVDMHLKAMEALGAQVTLEGGYILAEGRLKGATVDFPISTVGATGNALMAAARAEGETVIRNAAQEPDITALAHFLQKMGVQIEGIGARTMRITGQKTLRGVEERIIPDRVEAGTFLIAGALVGEKVAIRDGRPDHLADLLGKLRAAGAEIRVAGDVMEISRPPEIAPVDIVTAPYPGYPTDLQAQWMTFMTQAKGVSAIKDEIYFDRFAHVAELVRLGAAIEMEQNMATVTGPVELIGAPVMSTDIRASASILLAALAAEGRTDLSRVYHIDRGYEGIEKKLALLGARIRRTSNEL